MKDRGMTLLELMVVMVIFIIVVTASLTLLSRHTRRTSQETAKTRTTQEGIISDTVFIRDIAMAGLGVPVEYNGQFVPISSKNNAGTNGSDELIIKGAGISSGTYDYLKWGYNTNKINKNGDTTIQVSALPETGNYPNNITKLFTLGWEMSRSNYRHPFEKEDRIVFLNAETKALLSNRIYKIDSVNGTSITISPNPDFSIMEKGALIFSLGSFSNDTINTFADYLDNNQHFTGYKLSVSTQNDAYSLLRVYGSSMPVLDGVLDFQVQFGLVDASGNISWHNDISGYSPSTLKKQLKLVRIFIVKQYGKRDNSYNYPATSITTADHTINLTADQRHYHWRTVTLDIPLRELK